MSPLPRVVRAKLPFFIAGSLSFLLSVWLYFVRDEHTVGIFVGLWVPSIYSLGALLLTSVVEPVPAERAGAQR